MSPSSERCLTDAPRNHVLTHAGVWSPDGQWIVYDVRSSPERFDGRLIERVNVESGAVERLFESAPGSGCAVASYSPRGDEVVFIQGPEPEAVDWSYGPSRRRGARVSGSRPGVSRPVDAMNYAAPFTPGALRGGSHLHLFSGDGRWIHFTYEDEVSPLKQRNVGVSAPGRPVSVARSHPRNQDGDYFSVLVTRTRPDPEPGSDEIVRACEEGWIGTEGYVRPDGTRQRRALAFQGTVLAADGKPHAEVFVADVPDDVTVPADGPLEGTAASLPCPPRGATQRRLSFTAGRKFRGVQGPRHWLRSDPGGDRIAFLMRDDAGIAQFWLVSPNGGSPTPLTHNPYPVASAFTWSPDGAWIAHVMDNSVFMTEAATGRSVRLTARSSDEEAPLPLACVFSPDGRSIAYQKRVRGSAGAFAQIFVVRISA